MSYDNVVDMFTYLYLHVYKFILVIAITNRVLMLLRYMDGKVGSISQSIMYKRTTNKQTNNI